MIEWRALTGEPGSPAPGLVTRRASTPGQPGDPKPFGEKMPACQSCGSEVKRLQEFRLDYPHGRVAWICPNCFSDCIENAKNLRAMVGEVSLILAMDGGSMDGLTPSQVAHAIRGESIR